LSQLGRVNGVLTTINQLKQAIVTEEANCRRVWLIAPLASGVAQQQGGHIEHVM